MSSGYISDQVRARIRAQAKNRCGYCCSHQDYILGTLEINHFIPLSRGGTDDEENLWLACSLCNTFKASQTHAIDPSKAANPAIQPAPTAMVAAFCMVRRWHSNHWAYCLRSCNCDGITTKQPDRGQSARSLGRCRLASASGG